MAVSKLTEETALLRDAEKCYFDVINTMENDAVTNALYQCKLLNEQNCKNLKQNLTAHQMSCLNTQVILHVNEDDFVKICNYIDSQVQVKCLETLYYAYQSLPVSSKNFKASCDDDRKVFLGYSFINLQFIYLTQQIQTMINPVLLLDNCKRLMASKTYAIPLLSEDYLKGFSTLIKKPAVLFQALGIFWTWSDHSILKELLHMGKHTEALNLLEQFDRYLESFKTIPIKNFPLPILSPRMIPLDTNKHTHTILAIKYKTPFDKCTWQNIFELRNSLVTTFKVTKNALQLLVTLNNDSEFMLIYWMIPTSVIPAITSKITHGDHFCMLLGKKITEVAIYPKALFSADANLKVGPLAFFMDISSKQKKPPKNFKMQPDSLRSYLTRTEELPEIMQVLLRNLYDSNTQLAQITFKEKELSDTNKRKDADIENTLSKNVELQNTIAKLEKKVKKLEDNERDNDEKATVNYEQLQTDLLQSKNLIEEYEKQMLTLQQDKVAVNYEQLQIDYLQSTQLLKESEERVQALQQEKEKVESEFKTSIESLKQELSDLNSEIMMKTAQNQQLSEKNASLAKLINKLKEKEKAEKTKMEEENNAHITECNELKLKLSCLEAEHLTLTESIQARNEQFQTQLQSTHKELKEAIEHSDKVKIENSNLIAENDILNNDKRSLQKQLDENHKEIQKQYKVLKDDHTRLSKRCSSLKLKLTNCEKDRDKFKKTAHHTSSAVVMLCETSTQLKQNKSLCSPKKNAGPGMHDCYDGGDESSSSAISSSTVTTGTANDETIFPNQAEESNEDNGN